MSNRHTSLLPVKVSRGPFGPTCSLRATARSAIRPCIALKHSSRRQSHRRVHGRHDWCVATSLTTTDTVRLPVAMLVRTRKSRRAYLQLRSLQYIVHHTLRQRSATTVSNRKTVRYHGRFLLPYARPQPVGSFLAPCVP